MQKKNKTWDQVNSLFYDLTHLEINTIIKDEMTASKASDSPRVLLHEIAGKYSLKLKELEEKYKAEIGNWEEACNNLPNRAGEENVATEGSGYYSFRRLSDCAKTAFSLLNENRNQIDIEKEEVDSDLMLLKRIETISDDLRAILKVCGDNEKHGEYDFDQKETMGRFRGLKADVAQDYELDLDLRQWMVVRKAHDLGTENIVLQTIIGLDGDVTTRISRSFAQHPVNFINDLHHEAITISVNYWKTLVTIITEFGSNLIKRKK